MSNYFQKERNENSMGEPGSQEKMKGKPVDPWFKEEPKKSSGGSKQMEGLPSHDPESLPTDKGTAKSFDWLKESTPSKDSI